MAYGARVSGLRPEITRMPSGTIRVRYREFLATLKGVNSTYSVTNSFILNPGLSGTFPWASNLALSFNKWRLNRLKLCYYSECATTEQGVMMVSLNTDAAATQPATKQQFLLLEHSLRMNPWDSSSVEFRDLKTLGPWLFTRPCPNYASVPNSAFVSNTIDVHTYDAGIIFTAVTGTTTDTFGDLYIEYEIEFDEPVPSPGRSTLVFAAQSFPFANAMVSNAAVGAWLTTACQNCVQGDGQIRTTLGIIPPVGTFTTGDTIYLPQGQYIIVLDAKMAVNSVVSSVLSAGSSSTSIGTLASFGVYDGVGICGFGGTWAVTVNASNPGAGAPPGASGDTIRLAISSAGTITATTAFSFSVYPLASAQ